MRRFPTSQPVDPEAVSRSAFNKRSDSRELSHARYHCVGRDTVGESSGNVDELDVVDSHVEISWRSRIGGSVASDRALMGDCSADGDWPVGAGGPGRGAGSLGPWSSLNGGYVSVINAT